MEEPRPNPKTDKGGGVESGWKNGQKAERGEPKKSLSLFVCIVLFQLLAYGTSVVIRGTRFHSALLKGGELGTNFPQDDWQDLMSSHELT